MAVGTTAAIVAGGGMLAGGLQAFQGEKMRREAKDELNSYESQTLDNAYENVSISTLGSDLVKEESHRRSAGMVDALQQTGVRGVVGGIPKVVATMNAADMQAAKMLDDQYINREYAIAGDNARIEGIRENRDNMNISALSSQVDAGRKDAMNGMMGMLSSGAYLGREIDKANGKPADDGPNPFTTYNQANTGMIYNYPRQNPSDYYTPSAQLFQF